MGAVQNVLVALLLWGCAAPPQAKAPGPEPASEPAPSAAEHAAAERAAKYELDLPRATNTMEWPDGDVPHIVLRGAKVFVDDAPVENVVDLVAGGRLRRVDGLFDALKPRRDSQGVAMLWFDAATPALVVKSLFQTAAFAGFPNLGFAVRHAGNGRLARIDADARVPGPPSLERPAPGGDPFVLHLESREGKVQLVWKAGSAVVQVFDVPDGGLQKMIDEQWQRYGGHRDAADRSFDQAVLHVDNRARFDAIIGLIDMIYATRRDFAVGAESERVAAFNVTLAVN